MFFGLIFEFFPEQLEVIIEALIQLFEMNKDNLNPFTRMKIIQTLFLLQKKGYINFLKPLDFFLDIFEMKDKKLRLLVFHTFIQNIDYMVQKKKFFQIET